jgi:hypothetical protein
VCVANTVRFDERAPPQSRIRHMLKSMRKKRTDRSAAIYLTHEPQTYGWRLDRAAMREHAVPTVRGVPKMV